MLVTIITAVLCAALAETSLQPKTVQLESFEVVGIATRTNNAKEAGPQGAIPKLWQRFMQEHVLEHIPNKTNPDLYAVYTDYTSDSNGDYKLVIGAKVGSVSDSLIPGGMVRTESSRRTVCRFHQRSRPSGKGRCRNVEADLVVL